MTITPEQRAEWWALADAAIEGPWEAERILHRPHDGDRHWCWEVTLDEQPFIDCIREDEMDARETAEFIAASRQAVPALLDALDQVERERDEAEAAVQRVRDLHAPRVEEAITGACAEEECDHDGPCPTTPFTVCAECWRIAEASDPYFSERGIHAVLYPCPTMRALDGGGES